MPDPSLSPFRSLLSHQCLWHECGQRAAGIFETACCPCPKGDVQASTSRDGRGSGLESPAKVITRANLARHLWTSRATGRIRALKPLPVMPQHAARPADASQQRPWASSTARRRDSPRPLGTRPGCRIGARAELLLQNAGHASGHRAQEGCDRHSSCRRSGAPRAPPNAWSGWLVFTPGPISCQAKIRSDPGARCEPGRES
jgi:hypothetical protein